MKTKYLGLLASAGALCTPFAHAAGPTLSDVLVNSGITANGYVSASYNATFNSTNGATLGQVPLHAFDTNSNSFELNQAALTLSYLPSSGFGALVNVIAGEDAKIINATYSNGANSSSDFALTQGYLQYAVGNLTVIGGRFVTLAGAEVINDTANTNISRSLLFTNLEPLVHTGIRASYKFNDQFTGTLGFNNSAFGFSQDVDKPKTAEFGLTYTPTSAISVALADYYGVDDSSGKQTKNNFADLVASWQATSKLQLVLNGDYVRAIGSVDTTPGYLLSLVGAPASTPGSASGEGVAAYANYQFNDHWKASFRGEYLYLKASPSAVAGNASSHVAEGTATIDYSATKNFDLLGEYRCDYGDIAITGLGSAGIFPDSNNLSTGLQKAQNEVLVKAIYKFGTPSS